MSVIWANKDGWILCHSDYLRRMYGCIQLEELCSSCGRYQIIHIDSPFLKRGQKKYCETSFDDGELKCTSDGKKLGNYSKDNFKADEITILYQVFKNFMCVWIREKPRYLQMQCATSQGGNLLAMKAANEILRNTEGKLRGNYDGGNGSETAVAVTLENDIYFIPPYCRFYNYDLNEITNKFPSTFEQIYDLVLIDPPWPNKHIRRENASSTYRGYTMTNIDELVQLPIRQILSPNGLVAVWCTNSARQIKALISHVFPSWNIQYIGTWYWIKVTQKGQPICEFSIQENKKQPFERIIFGSNVNRCQKYQNPPPNKIIVSIPSSVHSHKPPLVDVLTEYLPSNSNCIELFARYLLPKWTSCGNEVLKLQHKSLFR